MSKTILITGASSGFGRITAEALARAGHTVFASMRDPTAKNRLHAQGLRQQGIAVVELDISSDNSVDQAVKEVLAEAGRIDVLINNAGIASAGITEAFTADQAKVVFNTNVVGLLRTNRAVLPTMRARGDGLIINIGSILGRVTFPFFGIYGASKFAVEALTDSLRYEVSQLGVGRAPSAKRLSDEYVRRHAAPSGRCACGRLRRDRRDPGQDVRGIQRDVLLRQRPQPS
jgi:NADP-dependent 3-hydroxy acid dehydrogenase YdfG